MRTNPVKAALEAGQTVLGSELSRLRSPEVAKLYALAGFDFVFIDMEHSAFGLETVADMIATARAAGIVPIVRVPQAEYTFVCRASTRGARNHRAPRQHPATGSRHPFLDALSAARLARVCGHPGPD